MHGGPRPQPLLPSRSPATAVLVVLSDSHRTDGTGLVGAAADAVDEADAVLHAGDFTAEPVLDSLRELAPELHAVHGNRDDPAVTDRLPAETTFEYAGVTVAATHRHRSGATGLTLLGRQQGAELVVFGHSHRPSVEQTGEVTLLNPGSYADPRGARQAFATLRPSEAGLDGALVTVDGETFATFSVTPGEG